MANTVTITLQGHDQASKVIGSATKDIESSLHGVSASSKKAKDEVGGMTSSLSGMISVAAGMGVFTLASNAISSVTGFMSGAVSAASDMAESQSKMQVVFGESSKVIEEFAQSAAVNMGMSRQKATEAAGTFGNLFMALGMGQKPAADMSTSLLQLASDLASFNNLNPDEVLLKLRSGLVGEAEPLRSLGVNINEATVKAQAMKMGLKGVNGELTDAEKVQARYALILEQTSLAQGDFARTADGMANASRIQKAKLEDLQASLGTKMLPIMLMVTKAATGLIDRLAGAGPVFGQMGEAIGDVLAPLARAGEVISGLFSDLQGEGGGLGVIADDIRELTGIDLSGFVGMVASLGDTFTSVLQAVRSGDLSGIFSGLMSGADQITTGLSEMVPKIGAQLAQWAEQFIDWIGPIIPPILSKLAEIGGRVVRWIATKVPEIGARMLAWSQAFIDWIGPMIPPFIAKLGELATNLVNWLMEQIPVLVGGLAKWASEFIAWVAPQIPLLVGKLGELISAVLDWIIANGPNILRTFIGEWVPAAIKWVLQAAIDIIPNLVSLIGTVVNWIITQGVPKLLEGAVKMGVAVVQGLLQGIGDLAGALGRAVGDAFAALDFWVGPFHITGHGIEISLPPISPPSWWPGQGGGSGGGSEEVAPRRGNEDAYPTGIMSLFSPQRVGVGLASTSSAAPITIGTVVLPNIRDSADFERWLRSQGRSTAAKYRGPGG